MSLFHHESLFYFLWAFIEFCLLLTLYLLCYFDIDYEWLLMIILALIYVCMYCMWVFVSALSLHFVDGVSNELNRNEIRTYSYTLTRTILCFGFLFGTIVGPQIYANCEYIMVILCAVSLCGLRCCLSFIVYVI
eukprot:272200_1